MNRVKYTGYPVEKYPLSTKGLDFIQEQIFLAAEYAKSAGGNFILSGCRPEGNSISAGTVIVDGEILPLKAGVAQPYIRIAEGRETLTGDGIVYENARTLRWVEFGEGDGENSYEWASFAPFPTNKYLSETMVTRQELDALRGQTMPKGAIIMWSGKVDNVPAGFRLCDGGVAPDYGAVPDLRGRFIVGLDPSKASVPVNAADMTENYGTPGNTGGQKAVALTKAQMPAHNHVTDTRFDKFGARAADTPDGKGTAGSLDAGAITTEYRVGEMGGLWEAATVKTEGGGELHENRPPYYVLAFIIKVV